MRLNHNTEEFPQLSAERQLLGKIAGADWSSGARRSWPADWFANIDPSRIPGLAWQYKLRPMTANALREAGWPGFSVSIRESIEAEERACAMRSLQQVSLLRTIVDAAAAINLRVIALKGVALSLRLYGDPCLREAFDLDLLVDPERPHELDRILHSLGYRSADDVRPLSPLQNSILERFSHDRKFVHAETGIVVERHHALADNPHLIATDFGGLWKRRSLVRIGPSDVAILSDLDLAHYLCTHASRHAWERWKWIADLWALCRPNDASQYAFYRASAAGGGWLTMFNAWSLLCHAVTDGAAAPAAEARTDRKAVRIAARALEMACINYSQATIVSERHNLRLIVYRMRIKSGLSYWAREILTLLHRDKDWRAWRLPDALLFVYYILRPFAYLRRGLAAIARP